jgi:hypothetical protein
LKKNCVFLRVLALSSHWFYLNGFMEWPEML